MAHKKKRLGVYSIPSCTWTTATMMGEECLARISLLGKAKMFPVEHGQSESRLYIRPSRSSLLCDHPRAPHTPHRFIVVQPEPPTWTPTPSRAADSTNTNKLWAIWAKFRPPLSTNLRISKVKHRPSHAKIEILGFSSKLVREIDVSTSET